MLSSTNQVLINKNEYGNMYIYHNAIRKILEYIIFDIQGVAEKDMNFFSRILNNKTGYTKITNADKLLELTINIKTYYGLNIQTIASEVQNLLKYKLQKILNIKNIVINIHVTDIVFAD